jgi:uncharacterized membrane protein HdeD (DUF308 family)
MATVFAPVLANWNWCATLGVVLIVIGVLAISMLAFSNIDSVPLLSWLILLSGIAEAVHAFHLRKSGPFFFHLVPGIAGIPLGLLVATHAAVDIVTWMLVFACFFTVIGLFRLLSALHLKFPGWTWAVFDSSVMLAFGALFWTASPRLGLWFFDLAVGVSLMARGWSSVMLGVGLRSLRTPDQTRPPTTGSAPKRTQSSARHSKSSPATFHEF